MGPGFWQVILIIGLAVVIFGARKIPKIARLLGQGLKEFKKALKDEKEAAGDGDKEKKVKKPRQS